jgi:hypothetical protein
LSQHIDKGDNMMDTHEGQVVNSNTERTMLCRLETTVERVTGQSAKELRDQTLTELRQKTEAKTKKKLTFISCFPLIGRGNVMRDKVVDHKFVEEQLQEALK